MAASNVIFHSIARANRRYCGLVLAAWVLLFFSVPAYGVRYFIDDVVTGNARIRVQCTDRGMMNALGFYGARCARLVDRVLGTSKGFVRKVWILEEVEGGDVGLTDGERIHVRYRLGGEELPFARNLFTALVRRRLESSLRCEITPGPFFNLVVSGLCHRYVRGRHALSGYYEPDYGIARDQFLRQDYPRVCDLLKTDLAPSHRFFYELYMLHGDLFVLAMEGLPDGRHGAVILNLLKAEQRGDDLFAAYERLTKRHWQTGENGQTFYQRMVYRVSRRREKLSGEDVIAERVKELETVSVLGYEGGTALRRVPLDEMPNVLEDYRTDVTGVMRLEERFRSLSRSSPYLLRPSLEQYIHALTCLRQGDVDGFKSEIAEARMAFKKAMERQRAMNRCISRYENEHVPALRRYVDFVKVVDYYRSLSDKFYPNDLFGSGKNPAIKQ